MNAELSSADSLLTPSKHASISSKLLPESSVDRERSKPTDCLRPKRRKKSKPKAHEAVQHEFKLSDLLRTAAASPKAADHLYALAQIQSQSPSSQWRGYATIPPGSLLESVCREFERGTSIPLEIPFAHLLAYVAGYLCRQGVHLLKGEDRVDPAVWIILLADSGEGKTWTTKRIKQGCKIEDAEIYGISGVASASMLFQKVFDNPTGLWLHDEFGQFIARLDRAVGDTEMKEYVLKIYDGDPLTRGTKKDGERTTEPLKICLLGMSQHETWHQVVPAQAMLDGTAQRFSYMVVRDDPSRDYKDFADWKVDFTGWSDQWQQCVQALQPIYSVSDEAMATFKLAFREYASDKLPKSFYRRVMYACHRLALLYHVLLCDPAPTLTTTDYGWALRLTRLFVEDCVQVIGENSMSELQRAMHKAKEIAERVRGRGRILRSGDLVANMRCISSASEAEGIMRLIRSDIC